MIAGVRTLGHCPCPRCCIRLDKVHLLGKERDRADRVKLARQDDDAHRLAVKNARKLIYEQNYAVDGSKVKAPLNSQSLVATAVSTHSVTTAR